MTTQSIPEEAGHLPSLETLFAGLAAEIETIERNYGKGAAAEHLIAFQQAIQNIPDKDEQRVFMAGWLGDGASKIEAVRREAAALLDKHFQE